MRYGPFLISHRVRKRHQASRLTCEGVRKENQYREKRNGRLTLKPGFFLGGERGRVVSQLSRSRPSPRFPFGSSGQKEHAF